MNDGNGITLTHNQMHYKINDGNYTILIQPKNYMMNDGNDILTQPKNYMMNDGNNITLTHNI